MGHGGDLGIVDSRSSADSDGRKVILEEKPGLILDDPIAKHRVGPLLDIVALDVR